MQPITKLIQAARVLIQRARHNHLIISPKTVVLASKKEYADKIVYNLAVHGVSTKHVHAAKDLGVGRSLGWRKCTFALTKRITATVGRVRRIKVLRKTKARAAKLVNTGAMPQATYGKEVCGVGPSAMHKLRQFAAHAVSSDTRGQCKTTCIWIGLGMHNDPWIKCTIDQMKTWFMLWGSVQAVSYTHLTLPTKA